MYYKGKWSDVGLDEIDTLIEFGTDMEIIEKEGVISQIGFFADKKAIALLNTRGFAVDYASKLAKLASEKGCNISILVDWDVSGLLIFMILKEIIPSIKRIGVDFNTVEDLGLEVKNVEEGYTAPEKHLKPLEEKLDKIKVYAKINEVKIDPEIQYLIDNLDYLRTNRIEINSVMVELDDNAVFYNWLENRLRHLFPNRNFTRSYVPPEYVQPDALEELNDFFETKGKPILAARTDPLKNKLADSGIKNAFLFDKTNKQLPDYNIRLQCGTDRSVPKDNREAQHNKA